MTHLPFVEHAGMAEARHAGAGVVGLGVPELAPGVLDDRLGLRRGRVGDAADLAVLVQARADRAERDLGPADLVAVVAIAPARFAGLVGPGHAAAVLGELLALLPVAEVLAVAGPLDGGELGGLDPGRDLGRRLGLAGAG